MFTMIGALFLPTKKRTAPTNIIGSPTAAPISVRQNPSPTRTIPIPIIRKIIMRSPAPKFHLSTRLHVYRETRKAARFARPSHSLLVCTSHGHRDYFDVGRIFCGVWSNIWHREINWRNTGTAQLLIEHLNGELHRKVATLPQPLRLPQKIREFIFPPGSLAPSLSARKCV